MQTNTLLVHSLVTKEKSYINLSGSRFEQCVRYIVAHKDFNIYIKKKQSLGKARAVP